MLLFRFAFEEIGLHRLQVSIIPRNRPSRRVAQKLWLRGEGIALRYLEIDGRWEDHVRYADHRRGVDRAPRPILPPVALGIGELVDRRRSACGAQLWRRTTAGEYLKNASTSES